MLIFNMSSTDAYPTQARLRQQARAKAGHVPKKRHQVVEQVFDDCGEDFTPFMLTDIEPCFAGLGIDPSPEENARMLISDKVGLNGSGFVTGPPLDCRISRSHNFLAFDSLKEFASWDTTGAGLISALSDDVSELCGGNCDTAYLLVRRGDVHGTTFDSVAGFNRDVPVTRSSIGIT